MVKAERVDALENVLDELNDGLEMPKEFILPGGCRAAAYCHLARTVCRRAERQAIKLDHEEAVTEISMQYLNRLSDLLFVMCRVINKHEGCADVLWNNESA